jgi:tetratricopeptide (TPR) repeat protein
MDQPVETFIHEREAQAGLGCVMCHAAVSVQSTMGNASMTVEIPALHDLATSDNPVVQFLHDTAVRLDPEPHRRTFLKPFHRQQAGEFCSTCHKVHLDVPVNHYRWIRGFNEYDAWQASAASGMGARSFYYPPQSNTCTGCHMPTVASEDMGNVDGLVHNHRFAAANTAVPVANQDEEQLRAVINFLQNKVVKVDIFGLQRIAAGAQPKPEAAAAVRRTEPAQRAQSSFAEVEEMGFASGVGAAGADVATLLAPLDREVQAVRRGESVRIETVVRTLGVGHFFPGGTVDAFDVWLELKAEDARGRAAFWSGRVEDNGTGPVERSAHFYRSFMLDGHGNPIDKRNAWATRSVLYVRLIPPGAADTVHFRLEVPRDAEGPLQLTAKLNYRKFSWFYTQFSFAGVRDPNQAPFDLSPHFDDGRFVFTGDTSQVSGKIKGIPNVPIVTMAEAHATLEVIDPGAPLPPAPQPQKQDLLRWNDYGIGLLLQGDLRGAEAAFHKVAELDPKFADGWVNIARVLVQEGDPEGALEVLGRALELEPALARAHYFAGLALKSKGEYQKSLLHLEQAAALYPRDRAVLNTIGRVRFLERDYQGALQALRRVLDVDPEDIQAHYNLMLAYRGLGDSKQADHERSLYLRFKADEASQEITGPYRSGHPEDNNERQRIHEHRSAPSHPTYGNAVTGEALAAGMNESAGRSSASHPRSD